jgi:chaperonin cofactor prefoldin
MQKLYDREQDLTDKLEQHLKTVELQIKTLDRSETS